jgi:hypothetical protein
MPADLTLDQLKRFVQRHFEDFVNKRNAAVIQKNMTADFYDHNRPANKPADRNGDEKMMVEMVLFSGDSKAARSRNAGQRSRRRLLKKELEVTKDDI